MLGKKVSRVLGVAALVTAFAVAPTVAHAVDEYPPVNVVLNEAPAVRYLPGGTVVLDFAPGTFSSRQMVSFTLGGFFAQQANVGMLGTVVQSLGHSKTAEADGSLRVSHTLPQNAAGTYNLTAATGGWARTWTFTVGPDVVESGSAAEVAAGNQLAETGYDELLWAWVAGGGIALVAGGIVVANSVRKEKKLTA